MAEVRITAVGARGDGLADADGTRLYVPLTAPGERVRVRIGARRGDGFVAEVVETLDPAPGRVTPPCPHFGACGGCSLQHLDPAWQAEFARDRVAEALARHGLDGPVEPARRVAAGTRRRATFAARRRGGRLTFGFHARSSHRLADVSDCLLLHPDLRGRLPAFRALLDAALGDAEAGALAVAATASGVDVVVRRGRPPDLALRERAAAWAAECDVARVCWQPDPGAPAEPVAVRRAPQVVFAGVAVDLPPGAFLQPSAEGEAILRGLVLDGVAGAARVADLYAGLGTFALPLAVADGVGRVHAVEGLDVLTGPLAAAAGRAGLGGRLTVETRDLDRRPLAGHELAPFDAVVFDPPRAGARAQAEALAASAVRRAVAVSCNPATLARDLRILVDGGFRVVRVVPVHQFPHSAHVEAVGVLAR